MALFLKDGLRFKQLKNIINIRMSSTNVQFRTMGATKILPAVAKSPLDLREYRAVELPNRLKAVLISDPQTDKSAASLSVAAGSMNDPVHLPGLAHFCEHMLFLGTEKYPTENDYSKFLSDNGGSSNAYTARDHTNYYFDISPQKLDAALDRFSQFFISPLFTESATEREVNAVNSEHDKNLSSDMWRINQLQCSLAKPNHPFSRFATGNRDTLWDSPQKNSINVRSALLDYHKQYYSANLMNLTVLGTETLDQLQATVEDKFSSIVNRDEPMPRWTDNPFNQISARADLVPVKDVRLLSVQFPIPDLQPFYKEGSDQYVAHLVGHEGPGSLLSLLKKLNWVNNLSAGSQTPGRGFGLFKVSVDLTPEGLDHTEDVITIIFQYLKLLREGGPQKWIWDELKDLSGLMFRYKDKEQPQSLVSQISSAMHDIPAEDILTAGFILSNYNPSHIKSILDHLTPEECLIMSTSKSYESKADLTEKWYGVKYSRELFPDECIKKWTNCEIHPDLKLPLPNSYIPTKFDLKPREEEKGIIPKVLADTGLSKIWFLQDNEFLMPKAVARVELYSSLPMLDPKHTNLNTMFVMVIKDLLTEESYAANAAGLSYAVSPSVYGVEAVAHGYDDKMGVLMKRVIETITNFSCTQDRFDVLKDTYYRQLKNFSDEQPYSHSMYYLAYLLREKRWLHHELMDAMKAVTLESLTRYANDFLENLRLEWLLCGNLTPTEAEGLVKSCEDYFKTKGTQPYLPSQVIRLRELKLNTGNYLYKNTHATHTSSCCLAFYEIGMLKMKESLVLEMLDHIANEPCFTQLRTQEQLGYIVFSGVRKSAAIEGLQILVQSDRHCAYVDSRIEDFLTNLDTILKNMTEEEFLQHRAGLSTRKSEKPKKLKDRQNIIWSEINTHLYEFDRQRIELIELEKVTLDEVIALFDSLVSPLAEKRKRLGIHVLSTANVGAGSKPNEADQAIIEEVEKKADIIQDPHFWKQTMKLWPLRMPSFLNKAKL